MRRVGRGGALRCNIAPQLRQKTAQQRVPPWRPRAWSTNTSNPTPAPAGYQVDDLTIELAPRRVRRAGTVIPLKALTFDLLVTLVRAAPNLLSFEQLSERVWPGLVISPETIIQRVKLLRGALGDDPQRTTLHRRGAGPRLPHGRRGASADGETGQPRAYRQPSLKETSEEKESPSEQAGVATTGAAAVSFPSAPPAAPRRPAPWGRLGWIGGTLIMVGLLAASGRSSITAKLSKAG